MSSTNSILDITNEYVNVLDNMHSSFIKLFNKLQLEDYTIKTIHDGKKMLEVGNKILHQLKRNAKTLETLLSDCSDFVDEITEDLSEPPKAEDFVFATKNGMMSYMGRDYIEKIKNPMLLTNMTANDTNLHNTSSSILHNTPHYMPLRNTPHHTNLQHNTSHNATTQNNINKPSNTSVKIEKVLINELGYYLKLPVVSDLKQIPCALYYVKPNSIMDDVKHNATTASNTSVSDTTQSNTSTSSAMQSNTSSASVVSNTTSATASTPNPIPGIYINLSHGNYVRIPFPEVVDSKKEYDRKQSIRCKYLTRLDCDAQRSKMAKMYNSNIRTCNFAHQGEAIVKIGYPSRCPSVPNFGNPHTMSTDIKAVTVNDIKNTMLYGLNDLISSVVWLDYNKITNLVVNKLEVA